MGKLKYMVDKNIVHQGIPMLIVHMKYVRKLNDMLKSGDFIIKWEKVTDYEPDFSKEIAERYSDTHNNITGCYVNDMLVGSIVTFIEDMYAPHNLIRFLQEFQFVSTIIAESDDFVESKQIIEDALYKYQDKIVTL